MRITLDLPDSEWIDIVRFTNSKTKSEAVAVAIADFNRRRRVAELVRHAGTCRNLMNFDELLAQRRR